MMLLPALDDLLDRLAEAEALLLEPQECYNKALLGIAERADGIIVAAYDCEKCIQAIAEANNWDYAEAQLNPIDRTPEEDDT